MWGGEGGKKKCQSQPLISSLQAYNSYGSLKYLTCTDSTNLNFQRKLSHVHVTIPSVEYEGDSLLASKNSSLIHSLWPGGRTSCVHKHLTFLPSRNFWVHQFRDLLLPTFWAALWGVWSLHLYWAKEHHLLPCHRCFKHEQPQQTTFVLEYHHQLVNTHV